MKTDGAGRQTKRHPCRTRSRTLASRRAAGRAEGTAGARRVAARRRNRRGWPGSYLAKLFGSDDRGHCPVDHRAAGAGA
jgi:hypothetical protein